MSVLVNRLASPTNLESVLSDLRAWNYSGPVLAHTNNTAGVNA